MSPATRIADADLAELVRAASAGDNLAWGRLVAGFDPMLRSVARSYRLSAQDVDDVVQATWVKLYEHIDHIREPAALAGWLATTVRRQSLRLLQRQVREQLTDDCDLVADERRDEPDAMLLESEQRVALNRALATLPDRQRRLMTLIVSQPDLSYEHISATLDMPVGSIGPIRARSLARMQRHAELREFALAG